MCAPACYWKLNFGNWPLCLESQSWLWWCIAMKAVHCWQIAMASIMRSWELHGSRHGAMSSWFWLELSLKSLQICMTRTCCDPCPLKEISQPWACWLMLVAFWLGEIPLLRNNSNTRWSSWPRPTFMSPSMLQASHPIGSSLILRDPHGARSCSLSFTQKHVSKRAREKRRPICTFNVPRIGSREHQNVRGFEWSDSQGPWPSGPPHTQQRVVLSFNEYVTIVLPMNIAWMMATCAAWGARAASLS